MCHSISHDNVTIEVILTVVQNKHNLILHAWHVVCYRIETQVYHVKLKYFHVWFMINGLIRGEINVLKVSHKTKEEK